MKTLEQLVQEAGFHTSGNEIFSPNRKENITECIEKLAKLLTKQQELSKK